MSRQHQAAAPQTTRGRETDERALELRRGGATYREIAHSLGVSAKTAHSAVMRALRAQVARVADLAEDVRTLELDRLDRLLRAMWPSAMQGSVQHAQQVLRIMERRATMLGLDAPKKLAATTDGDQAALTPGVIVVPAQLTVDEWQRIVQQHTPVH